MFYVGADPVALGLVESPAKPGGRLTGVHGLTRDITAKRLAVLKEMIPRLRRVVTFYNPGEPLSRENARLGRDAARQRRDRGVPRSRQGGLERAGHRVKVIPGIGAVAGAGLDADGVPVAAGDRRKDGGQAVVR